MISWAGGRDQKDLEDFVFWMLSNLIFRYRIDVLSIPMLMSSWENSLGDLTGRELVLLGS